MAPLLTVHDVAHLLRLHPNTIWKIVGRGELVATRIGGALRFAEDDVAAYARRCRVVPPTAIAERPKPRLYDLPPGTDLDDINELTGNRLGDDIERWEREREEAASPAAGRTRGAGTKKGASVRR